MCTQVSSTNSCVCYTPYTPEAPVCDCISGPALSGVRGLNTELKPEISQPVCVTHLTAHSYKLTELCVLHTLQLIHIN